ncbi:hypothetical protein MARPO_0038s0113 [Marchantia polymorpha]|uniref:Uncharacterized protein n=1 Tax=Marchantia polymorpha TaxID=3197 RepID=A0A2R6X3X9_MARPO|nr:hypothetical protein MARPO_0038s0113 [Marchantia polymorpha]|eukprot:PTQ40803.1 hypothetical protein MARPO_0038s0113 [Marchantia polymorpha]
MKASCRQHIFPMQGEGQGRGNAGVVEVKLLWAVSMCCALLCMQYLPYSIRAEPILASSLGFCKTVPVLRGAPLHCCLPPPARKPIRFKYPTCESGGPPVIRERKPGPCSPERS